MPTIVTRGSASARALGFAGLVAPATTPTVEYLVVAGGGSGGATRGGGGGAGGYQTATGYAVTAGSPITVTVGAGGAGAIFSPATNGTSGNNSVFGSITSVGGGRGASRQASNYAASSGGSGGGGSEADPG